jgi:hypothetical protein
MAQTTADGRGIITSTRRESAARWRDAWHREQRATDEATTERRGARGVRRRRHGFCWLWPIVAWCPAPVPHACCLPSPPRSEQRPLPISPPCSDVHRRVGEQPSLHLLHVVGTRWARCKTTGRAAIAFILSASGHTHQEEDQLNPALARWQQSLVLENPPTSSLTTQWIRHPALFI